MSELLSIPSYLLTPPTTAVDPPVSTLCHHLPYEKIGWKDFERLCLRLAEGEGEVVGCRFYGTQGDEQEGIDLYGKKPMKDKYTVFQCKNEKEFGPQKIKDAITEFLDGSWASRSEKFVLCMREGITTAQREAEIRAQTERLEARNIEFESWDGDGLDRRLRRHPEIVADFFGRAWVEHFNGPEAVTQLQNRLDAQEVRDLRARLALLYGHLFDQLDPGLLNPDPSITTRLHFADRFVFPDVYEQVFPARLEVDSEAPQTPTERELPLDPLGADVPARRRILLRRPVPVARERSSAEDFVARSAQAVLVGGPGCGKSSFLRFLAIDLLRDSPCLMKLARRWGTFLPIWVPFGLWTQLIARTAGPPPSLPEVMRTWLRTHAEETRLWPLVEKSLQDERLLLLVDGLDEWTSEETARLAITLLNTFVGVNRVVAILTCRSQGFDRLGLGAPTWAVAEIADFSPAQQRQFAERWFRHWLPARPAESSMDRAANATEEFIRELGDATDLQELAKVPLLLGLLLSHHVRGRSAPRSRFQAYRSLVDDLLAAHPERRRRAALVSGSEGRYRPEELLAVFAALAFHTQTIAQGNDISREEAASAVVEFLGDQEGEFGYTAAKARSGARECLEVAEDSVGLLVRTAPDRLGFFHPALREFLAAVQLLTRPIAEQEAVLTANARDPRWREVILGLLRLTPAPDQVRHLVEAIRVAPVDRLGRHAINSILDEVVFSDFRLPARFAKELATETFARIETGDWFPERLSALRSAVRGLRSPALRDVVRERMGRWFPKVQWSRGTIYRALAVWPKEDETSECLYRAISDERLDDRRAAAHTLAGFVRGDERWRLRIRKLALTPGEQATVVAAHEALFLGWPTHTDTQALLIKARSSSLPELRLLATAESITQGQIEVPLLDELLALCQIGSGASGFQDSARAALKANWAPEQRERIRLTSLASLTAEPEQVRMDPRLGLWVLLESFPGDEALASYLVTQLRTQQFPIIWMNNDNEFWSTVAQNYPDHTGLRAAVDERARSWESHHGRESHQLVRLGRTEAVKKKLLSMLDTGFRSWPVWALLDGWGMGEPEVCAHLRDLATGDSAVAAEIGFLIPRILTNPDEARQRLMQLLRDPDCGRPDLLVRGLAELPAARSDPEVPLLVLTRTDGRKDMFSLSARHHLIEGWSGDTGVRAMALVDVQSGQVSMGDLARLYAQDPDVRALVRCELLVLPTRLRLELVSSLARNLDPSGFARDYLGGYAREQDEEVRTAACIGHHARRDGVNETESKVATLRAALGYRGIDHERVRQAAFCGLVTLGRIDVVKEGLDSADMGSGRTIPLTDLGGPNTPLIKCVLEHWVELKSGLGADFLHYFSRFTSSPGGEIAELYPFAASFPEPSSDLIEALRTSQEESQNVLPLRFVARLRPRDPFLAERALKILAHRPVVGMSATVAAEILGEHFHGDEDILQRLLATRQGRVYDPAVTVGLCIGWPESPALQEVCEWLNQNQDHQLELVSGAYLYARREGVEQVQAFLLGEINHPDPSNGVRLHYVLRPMAYRIRADEELLEILLQHLRKGATASEKTFLTRLIAAGRGIGPNFRVWCASEVEAQYSRDSAPECGWDPTDTEYRPVAHVLLDALTGVAGMLRGWAEI